MNGICLHIDDESLIDGLRYPYRAHLQLQSTDSAVCETVESVFVELHYDKISAAADHRLHRMDDAEQSAIIFKPIVAEALNVYMFKRINGENIDGEPRHH